MTPLMRAIAATVLFSVVAVISLWKGAFSSPYFIPHILFYAVLTLNTFFSVKLYASIQPKNIPQFFIDAVLGVLYIALALSIGDQVLFSLFALLVFIAATPKYALMLGKIPHEALLRRKIKIDTTGIALCAAVFIGTILGFGMLSAWVLAVVFALANVYLLLIRPMYRI